MWGRGGTWWDRRATAALQVEEGLCQLMALLWLEKEVASMDDPRQAADLASGIRNDPSPVYGGGVRLAMGAPRRAPRPPGLRRRSPRSRALTQVAPL